MIPKYMVSGDLDGWNDESSRSGARGEKTLDSSTKTRL